MQAVLRRTRSAAGGSALLPGGPAKAGKAGKAGARKAKSGAAAGHTSGITGSVGSVEHLASALIAANYDAEDFRRFLGVNHFNEVTWFNKEAFEETLRYSSLFLLAEDEAGPVFASIGINAVGIPADGAGDNRAALIAALGRALLRAEEASGYRLDGLLRILSEDSSPAPTGV
jgi:hypothetical protein